MDTIFIFTIIAILFPIIGAFIVPLLKKWSAVRDVFGVTTIAVSAISAVIIFILYSVYGGEPISHDFAWLDWVGSNGIQSGFYLDPLSVLMTLIVSVLSMLIAFFSLEYMAGDKYLTRYWFFLQLFVGGMLLLVLAHDMIFLFIGWEIVGLCSCFLIRLLIVHYIRYWYLSLSYRLVDCSFVGNYKGGRF